MASGDFRWRCLGSRAIEDADCLIVQAHNFVGELVAVLQFVPWGNDGLSLDLVRRHPDLENGVMELMIAELLAAAPSRGVSRVSLNFAVFRSSLARGERIGAGPFLRAWVRAAIGCLPVVADRLPVPGKCQVSAGLGASLHLLQARSRSRADHRRRSGRRRIPPLAATPSTPYELDSGRWVVLSLTGIPLLIAAILLRSSPHPLLLAWWWRRKTKTGWLSALRPLAAVLACQLLAISALFLWVNNQYGFYTSWSDLFGVRTERATIQTQRTRAGPALAALRC